MIVAMDSVSNTSEEDFMWAISNYFVKSQKPIGEPVRWLSG